MSLIFDYYSIIILLVHETPELTENIAILVNIQERFLENNSHQRYLLIDARHFWQYAAFLRIPLTLNVKKKKEKKRKKKKKKRERVTKVVPIHHHQSNVWL